ncbi:MT-A70 family methyltransferase [Methylosinus sp. Sm6]|uniref:MT-A70 family methyltransferase n=1 Tax=Methylosinus sp. Sm6 TaxID=2866948 RepID=UPI001C998947|nr:MT-A70 family methyltransferase [Methylosinus sp. Sm6]MBY6244171.1 DNA methyltransferase [Methylosinus sp. Sm6]
MSADWPFGELQPHSYGLILSDPPWSFGVWGKDGHNKGPEMHYDTMSRSELFSLPVWKLAAPNCAHVMWTTQAQLPLALDLLLHWGFDYRSCGSWAKQSKSGASWAFGTGYWFRSAAELFLVGAIGAPRIMSHSERNLIVAPVREHSRKPDEMHEMLERMFPRVRKLEMFARRSRPGWDSWGDERTLFDEAAE